MWKKFLLAMVLLAGLAAAVSAQEPNRAALVVALADGQVLTRCVEFAEVEISGYELLSRSGLALETSAAAMGAAVCRIEAAGCPANDCFCECKGGGDCVYWSYWHLKEGRWQYAQSGAGLYQVQNGAVDGWTWGPGSVQAAIEPPLLTFDDVCAVSESVTPPPSAERPVSEPPASQPAAQWGGIAVLAFVILGLAGLFVTRRGKGT